MGKVDKAVEWTNDEIDVAIEGFTQKDFTSGTMVYDWLYDNFGSDSFTAGMVKDKLSKAARTHGVRNFSSMWKLYLKEKGIKQKDTKRLAPVNSTNCTNQK